jgi:hypothetical protein
MADALDGLDDYSRTDRVDEIPHLADTDRGGAISDVEAYVRALDEKNGVEWLPPHRRLPFISRDGPPNWMHINACHEAMDGRTFEQSAYGMAVKAVTERFVSGKTANADKWFTTACDAEKERLCDLYNGENQALVNAFAAEHNVGIIEVHADPRFKATEAELLKKYDAQLRSFVKTCEWQKTAAVKKVDAEVSTYYAACQRVWGKHLIVYQERRALFENGAKASWVEALDNARSELGKIVSVVHEQLKEQNEGYRRTVDTVRTAARERQIVDEDYRLTKQARAAAYVGAGLLAGFALWLVLWAAFLRHDPHAIVPFYTDASGRQLVNVIPPARIAQLGENDEQIIIIISHGITLADVSEHDVAAGFVEIETLYQAGLIANLSLDMLRAAMISKAAEKTRHCIAAAHFGMPVSAVVVRKYGEPEVVFSPRVVSAATPLETVNMTDVFHPEGRVFNFSPRVVVRFVFGRYDRPGAGAARRPPATDTFTGHDALCIAYALNAFGPPAAEIS